MKKPLNDNVKLILLYIGSFLVSSLPLLIALGYNWNKYTATPSDTTKLCFGGIIVLVFIFLKIIGKLNMPHQVWTFASVFILAFLLEKLLDDLILLSGCALLGEVLDLVIFQHLIKKTKLHKQQVQQAIITNDIAEERHKVGRGG